MGPQHDPLGRCSEEEIRRACGSQSLPRLQEAVQSGWTPTQLDAIAEGGKSALQFAAWKGCLSNVVHLVQLGCNINNYSTATYSYGKTAIFFALTQSRRDVVEYLLQVPGIQVAIVNNKGQSVLSLAATHDMPDTIISQIQQLERDQTWWNFRATHSDGLHYGDLDPRFLDRPLQETDVITPYAINPTCHSTRKGNFARKNPQVVQQQQPRDTNKVTKKNKHVPKKTKDNDDWILQEKLQLQLALDDLNAMLGGNGPSSSSPSSAAAAALLQIVQLSNKVRFAWLPHVVDTLRCHVNQPLVSSLLLQTKELAKTLEPNSSEQRWIVLLDKISQRLCNNPHPENDANPELAATASHMSISTNGNHPKNTNHSNPLIIKSKQSRYQQAQDLLQSMLSLERVNDSLKGLSMAEGLGAPRFR